MQGSFWKTVAVVGVIGIGSLTILEVQNRLPRQNSAAESDSDSLADVVSASGDKTVEALLTDSDFDKMLAVADAAPSTAQAQFDLQEPPVADEDSRFFNSDPVAAQPMTPPVNTDVRAELLAEGGNPFMEQESATAVAANYQGEQSQTVKPVGFVQDETFTDDNDPAATIRPFLRSDESGDAAAIQPTEEPPFSLFGQDAATDPQPAPETALTPTPNNSAKLKFFNGTEEPNTAPVQDPPVATAQFYEPDETPLQPTPDFDSAPAFDETPDSTPDSTPPSSAPPSPFQQFPESGSPAPQQPSNQPPPNQQPTNPPPAKNSQGGFFEEDLVPAPREPESNVPEFQTDFGSEAEPSFPTPAPEPRPTAPASRPDSSLPFAADVESSGSPGSSGSFTIPQLEEPGRLSIPDSQAPFSEDTTPGPAPGFPEDVPPRESPIEFRPLPSTPNRNPGLTLPEPSQPTPGREFNSGREFPGGTEFNGTPSEFDIDNRSSGGIRQVSGVMRPNLVLQKTAPENATVGSPLDYTIFVRNEGDATAFEVVVEDEVTADAQVDGARPKADYDQTTNKLIWKFAEILPSETKEIVVRVTPTGEGMLDGVASVKFKSRVKATTVITAPKLRLQMAGPDEVKLGEEVAYRYVITNEGTGEARDVFLRTVLPESGGLKHPQGRDLEYEINTMQPGEQREIVLAVVAAEPGEYRTEAEISATGGAKDQAAWRTNIVGAQLQIVRRGPKRRFVGRPATYENIVSNETNFDATDARIVEVVPEGMRFISASSGGQFSETARTVTWKINRLGPGRQEQFQIELMPTSAGARESVVTIFENAGLQSDDYVSTTVVEDLHNVGAKMSQLDGPVAVGETFGFTINIDNRGTADATDVELAIDVPREIQVVGAGSRDIPAKLLADNVVQYNVIVRIEPNARMNFELKLKGAEPVRNGVVKAKVRYKQMEEPLVVSESVTVYREDL